MKRLLLLLPLLLLSLSKASANIYMTNDKPFAVKVFMWKTNGTGVTTLIQSTNLPAGGTNKFTSNDLYDGVGEVDTNFNFAARLRLFPLKSGDVAIHTVGNGGSKLTYFLTNASAIRFANLSRSNKTDIGSLMTTNARVATTNSHLHSYTYVTNKAQLVTSTCGDFGLSNKTFTLNRTTYQWTNSSGTIGTNFVSNTNVIVAYGFPTNYGNVFYWNANWSYTSDSSPQTGAWTNANGYFVASDDGSGEALGTLNDFDNASQVARKNASSTDPTGDWDYPCTCGGFTNRVDSIGVKIKSTARGNNVIYSNAASVVSAYVAATNVSATPVPTVSYKVRVYTNF